MSMSELADFQREVGEWARETFPQATDRTICTHLADEVVELDAARGAEVREEAVDVFLILLHYCDRHGIDLLAEGRAKLLKCRARAWASDERRGYVRHVEDGAP